MLTVEKTMDGLKVKVVVSLLLAFQESRGFQFPASGVPIDNDGTEKALLLFMKLFS